jgi:hypothetical protein
LSAVLSSSRLFNAALVEKQAVAFADEVRLWENGDSVRGMLSPLSNSELEVFANVARSFARDEKGVGLSKTIKTARPVIKFG